MCIPCFFAGGFFLGEELFGVLLLSAFFLFFGLSCFCAFLFFEVDHGVLWHWPDRCVKRM